MTGFMSAFVTAALMLYHSTHAESRSVPDRLGEARGLRAKGEIRRALETYEEALGDLRASGRSDLLLTALLEATQTAISAGEYGRATTHAASAIDVSQSAGDVKSQGLANNLLGQARLYEGSYPGAVAAFERALELADAQHDTEAASIRLGNIGNVRFFQGRYLDALHSYELALQRCEAAAPAQASNARQLALANLAVLYEQLGQYETSLAFYQRSAAAASALKPSEYGQLLSNMGTLYRRMGDPVKALQTYDVARETLRKAAHSDGEIHVLHNTGLVLALDQNALGAAIHAFTEALRVAETSRNRRQIMLGRLFRGEALLRLKRFAVARAEYQMALAAAREIGARDEEWTAEYGIGQTLEAEGNTDAAASAYRDAIAVIERLRGGLATSTLKTEFLGNKRSVYDAAISVLMAGSRPDPDELFGLLESARARNLQDALLRQTETPTIEKLQRRLDAKSMLVEFWVGRGRAAALWITDRERGVVAVRDGSDALVRAERLARAFQQREDSSWRSDAEALGRVLLGGLPLENGRSHLIVVPDGVLCVVPFDLLAPKADRKLLIESVAVSYLPAAALLLRAPPKGRRVMPWRRQVVVFGDPIASPADQISASGWARLPAARQEIRDVARAMPGRAELRVGSDDLKSYLTSGGVSGTPVLHFTTHAAVDPLDVRRSRMLFTAERGNPGSAYLFWPEAQTLSLSGVDLVTLAACETEGGKLIPGEGIQSFSRAFLESGAQSTVTALWRVADRPTADLMRVFYSELGKGVSKAEALRRAKLSLLRSTGLTQSPQYWAAFVLTGDGRRALPIVGWPAIGQVAAGVAIAALLTLIVAIRRRRMSLPGDESDRKDTAI